MKFKELLEKSTDTHEAIIFNFIGSHPTMFKSNAFYIVSGDNKWFLIETGDEYNSFSILKEVKQSIVNKFNLNTEISSNDAYLIATNKIK